MLEENDYDDENDRARDPAIILRHQKYATRFYIFMFIVSVYILFYTTMIIPEGRTIIITDDILQKLKQFYSEYDQFFICPCSNIRIPYKNFVSFKIKHHPVCESIFVSPQWIEALYFPNASQYKVPDFRTTASSQATSLCSFSKQTVLQNQNNLHTNELITLHLHSELQIQSEINARVEMLKKSSSTKILSFIDYLRIVTRANYFISALNTNAFIGIYGGSSFIGYTVIYELQWHLNSSNEHNLPCSNTNPISPASLVLFIEKPVSFSHHLWYKPLKNSTLVNGFFTACTPLEALLKSTLDCLYDTKCLQLLTQYFPNIQKMNLNLTDYVLSPKKNNHSIYDYLINLFIDEWSTEINYSKYYDNCNPSSCIDTKTSQIDLSYSITLFISLYGGIIMTLRMISPFIISTSMKLIHCSIWNQISVHKLSQFLKKLNLFKIKDKRTENDIKEQKLTTYIYLVLLIGSFVILLFFNVFNKELVTKPAMNISLIEYNELQKLYSDTLRCSCSNRRIAYDEFVLLSPKLHQVCSSIFVKDEWISILKTTTTEDAYFDWRSSAYQQFQLLSNLCKFANKTIENAINQFNSEYFVVSNLINEINFNVQLNTILNRFYNSTILYFDQLIDIVNLLIQIDQPNMARLHPDHSFNPNLIAHVIINEINDQKQIQVKFNLPAVPDIHTKLVHCICATNLYCQHPVPIYNGNVGDHRILYGNYSVSYVVPGSIATCSPVNSLLLSTLECFYSHSKCFPILINYIKEAHIWNTEYPSWTNIPPLIYNETSDKYPPNTSISMIIKNIMIEHWNASYSYNRFYKLCAPTHCYYDQITRKKPILQILLTLSSILGSLISGLRFIIPHLMKFINYLLPKIRNRHQQQHQQIQLSYLVRLKSLIIKLIKSLYNILINLNIFMLRDFGTHINRTKAKELGQWATRLYIILIIILMTIFYVYNVVQSQTKTKIFDGLTFDIYNEYKRDSGYQLKCSCSSITTMHNQFTQIRPVFHEICSSSFSSDEWINNLTTKYLFDLSIYEVQDYRRFFPSHLQYLSGLCYLSMKLTNNSIEKFLSSILISDILLSEEYFDKYLDDLIEHTKSNIQNEFTSLLSLVQNINHGNKIISTYGTNFQYVTSQNIFLYTQPIIYDNQCSCGLYSNCTTQAMFIDIYSRKNSSIKGLKIGCTPSQSLHFSTLECFYNISCLNLIKRHIDYTKYIIPLSKNMNRFKINTSISELIDNLFVDQWLTTTNYSSYFEHCAPLSCSYTYIQHYDIFLTITLVLSIQNGLSIVLRWICPLIIRSILKINQYRRRRITPIQSIDSISTNIASRPVQYTLKNYLTSIIIIVFLITSLIIFSIYAVRKENKPTVLITNSTTIDTVTGITKIFISSTQAMPICELRFQSIPMLKPNSSSTGYHSPIIVDYNNDNLLDIMYFSRSFNILYMLRGYGNGTFKLAFIQNIHYFTYITTADLNHDNQLDIISVDSNTGCMLISLGNVKGTVEDPIVYPLELKANLIGIAVADFNNDNHSDIAITNGSNSNVALFFGNGKGTFSQPGILYTGDNNFPTSIAASDFNGDDCLDIVVVKSFDRNIGIFLGHGDGTFDTQMTFFTGGEVDPVLVVVDDFNNDKRQDVLLCYSIKRIGVMFGYGNGTFGAVIGLNIGASVTLRPLIVSDFNKDGYRDIVVSERYTYSVTIFFGDGKGNFIKQTLFSYERPNFNTEIVVGDFNRDGYQDIFAIDIAFVGMDLLLNTGLCYSTNISETSTRIP